MSKADELGLLREAIKSFPDALAVRDADGRVIACSASWEKLSQNDPGGAEVQAADGRWLRRIVRRLDGGGSVELLADVTELRRSEQAVRFLAYHDTLTDLGAGACFNDARVEVEKLAH